VTQPPQIADTAHTAENAAPRTLRVLVAAALAVLLVLAGVDPWWMIPLAAVAAPLGLSDGGARLGTVAFAVAAGAGAVAVLAGWADLRDALVTAARDVVTGVLPWSVAIAWRVRRSAEADAAMALLREQDADRLRAETDLARQRLHLAEGLHDDLGHALSLVAVNLGRLELELEQGLETERGPDAAASALESVGLARRQVSDAVDRLGTSVQTLRTGLAESPETFRTDLDALVQDARRAGADVELTGSPDPGSLAGFGPAVVRVVQEGLTNALKHAPGQPVRVALDASAERLVVAVRNPLPESPPESSDGAPRSGEAAPAVGGTGVRSLIEHVRAAGGSVEAGPVDSDYVLRAELRPVTGDPKPTPSPIRPGATSRDARTVTHGLVQARRRGGALLLTAVLVPAAVLVAVAVAIQLADNLGARRALLAPGAFDRITVGDTRSGVQPLLPAATLDPLPGADPSCDYYAVTADPLDDASGDAYRICWADDHVASTDLVVGGAR
jgi:signal transduction histidine kinase